METTGDCSRCKSRDAQLRSTWDYDASTDKMRQHQAFVCDGCFHKHLASRGFGHNAPPHVIAQLLDPQSSAPEHVSFPSNAFPDSTQQWANRLSFPKSTTRSALAREWPLPVGRDSLAMWKTQHKVTDPDQLSDFSDGFPSNCWIGLALNRRATGGDVWIFGTMGRVANRKDGPWVFRDAITRTSEWPGGQVEMSRLAADLRRWYRTTTCGLPIRSGARPEGSGTWATRDECENEVRDAVGQLRSLSRGEPTQKQVAKRLKVGERTLGRALKQHQLDWKELKGRVH